MKKKLLIALLILVIIGGGLFLKAYLSGTASTTADVYQNGKLLYSFDLTNIHDTTRYTITYPDGGYNTIQVSPEGIGVIDADCPDLTCKKQGIRAHGPTPIVCLPHRISIEFTDSGQDDLPDAIVS